MEKLGREGGCTLSLHETQQVPGDAISGPISPQLMGRGDSCAAQAPAALHGLSGERGSTSSRGQK